MSKVQGRDANLFSDLASTTIAGQLESRLKELERNIAVARQFIKLADECYSQVRHEWELLQQDSRPARASPEFPQHSSGSEYNDEDTFEEISTFKEKKSHLPHDKTSKASESTSTHTPSLGSKLESPKRKETEPEPSNENKASDTPQKPSKESRHHRKGKPSFKQ